MKIKKKSKVKEISDYDQNETTSWIDSKKKLSLQELGLKLPPSPPSQVVSIRLPTPLLNKIRAEASEQDVPYQALIKIALAKAFEECR